MVSETLISVTPTSGIKQVSEIVRRNGLRAEAESRLLLHGPHGLAILARRIAMVEWSANMRISDGLGSAMIR